MNSRNILLFFILVLFAVSAYSLTTRIKVREETPFNGVGLGGDGAGSYHGANILLISVDCMRKDHIGFYGYARNTTPVIDELAESSTVFMRAYSHAPWTHPSLSSLHTGLHPLQHGVTGWNHVLSENLTTLAEVLQSNGYHTEAYVSHLLLESRYGYPQGFDYYDESVMEIGHPHHVSTSRELTDTVINRSSGWGSPFFVWVHYFDPHFRYMRHEEFDYGRASIDRYDSEISYTDYHIGRLLDNLRDMGLYDKTIIIVMADHGEEFGEHGGNLHKKLYNEIINIPLIMRVPGVEHKVVDESVVESDLMPTLIKLVGANASLDLYGVAMPLTDGGFVPEGRAVYSETRRYIDSMSIIDGESKLVINNTRRGTSLELFNLTADPGELSNIASRRDSRALAERLQQKLIDFYSEPAGDVVSLELSKQQLKMLKDLGYVD
ncbi:MAG: sulfatase [Candidatus Altiarchaeota archaeon]